MVPSEGGRRGRRDNGLDAVAFVPLLDVDPRVGEHLLDVLGLAGVPAYLEPSADTEPYTRAYALPSPPTDRLWVDREQRLQARQIVDAERPSSDADRDDEPSHGLTDLDEERAWEQIVAGWDADTAQEPGDGFGRAARRAEPGAGPATGSPARPWPGEPGDPASPADPADPANRPDPAEEGDEPAGGDAGRGEHDDSDPPPAPPLPTPADLDRAAEARARAEQDAREDDQVWLDGPPEVDEGHYQPPPPPPLPRLSRQAVLASLLLAIGGLLIVAPGIVGLDDLTGLTFGVASVLGGAAVLVLRLRDTRSDDGPDDGAVL